MYMHIYMNMCIYICSIVEAESSVRKFTADITIVILAVILQYFDYYHCSYWITVVDVTIVFSTMMMIIGPSSRVRKGGKERREVKEEYRIMWGEEERNDDYEGMVQPSQLHVAPCVMEHFQLWNHWSDFRWVSFISILKRFIVDVNFRTKSGFKSGTLM